MYTPDNWVILRIAVEEKILYKILAGWSGGYLEGDHWRLNSGIERVEEEDDADYILFHGHSGSVYNCHKQREQLRMNCAYVVNELQAAFPNKVGVISYSDFLEEWENPN